MTRAVYFLEFLLYAGVRALFLFLPLRWALWAARRIGSLLYAVDGEHRKIGLINLHRAYGSSLSLKEARALLRRSYQHQAMSVAEGILFSRLVPGHLWKRHIEVRNADEFKRAGLDERGFLLVTAHLGNWEMCGLVLPLLGLPLATVVKPLQNPYLEAAVSRLRRQTGQEIIPKEGAYKGLLRAVHRRQPVVLLLDQNVKEAGIFVDFFGRPAWTLELPAKLALRFGVPVVLGYTYRTPDPAKHVIVFGEWLDPASGQEPCSDTKTLTAYLTKKLEGYVRLYPDQWIWRYRRWLNRPDGSLENYEQPLAVYWEERLPAEEPAASWPVS